MSTPEQRVGKRAEQKRQWDRENKTPCADCGKPTWRHHDVCRSCHLAARSERHEARLARIAELYNAGVSLRDINAAFGVANVCREMDELRRAGRIGYRYKAYERKAAA